MEYVKGNFRKSIFKSDKGYIIGLFKVREVSSEKLETFLNKTITFTGYFHELNENDYYQFNGEFIIHEKYGEQFNVSSYEVEKPTEKSGIIEFLSSDLFKGIGEKKAIKIVEVLGNDCLNIIINNPNNLLLVPEITEKQKNTIYESLIKYQTSYDIILELTNLGFNTKDALTIFYQYKKSAIDKIKENIYQLTDDINEMSFKKIDSLRDKLDIAVDDARRIETGLKYALLEASNVLGDIYLYKNELFNYAMRILKVNDYDKLEIGLSNLIDVDKVIKKEEKYYLSNLYLKETYIAKRLTSIAKKDVKKEKVKLKENHIIYNKEQTDAILSSFNENFLVITGGPGTGKTTIIRAITELYQDFYKLDDNLISNEIALLAPTGRASKRISEATNLSASTIHRFLKWDKETDLYAINENNKSKVKLAIIDEASMIDINVFYNLLLGLEEDCKIVLVGDYDQLPSVGPGQLLKDIIESDMFKVVKLKTLYRQASNSNIIKFAHDIKNQIIDDSIFKNDEEDLIFIDANNSNLKEKLLPIIQDYRYDNYHNFQILAPIYAYENGIDDLNKFLQGVINKENSEEINCEEFTYKEKDKILQLVNIPDENVFNGDIGIIKKINSKPKEIFVDYDNNVIKFTPSTFNNIKHGYCISIHKSQGSEFDTIVIPILNKYNKMLYKKLIYTAVTRAKKHLYLIGEKSALNNAIMNDSYKERKTTLKNFIIDSMNS